MCAVRRPVQAQHAAATAAQPAGGDIDITHGAAQTYPISLGEALPGGRLGRLVIGPLPDSSAGASAGSAVPQEAPAAGPPSRTSFLAGSSFGTGRLVTMPGQRPAL